MSADAQSSKAQVASTDPHEPPSAIPEQSNAEGPPPKKDLETIFREAFEEANRMTSEERLAKHPFLRVDNLEGVPADRAMYLLEEMERKEREEMKRDAEREEAEEAEAKAKAAGENNAS